jgi:hypothetical protein
MHSLRNLGRRKVRTSLTVIGITIGIWALVVFGTMANKIDALVSGGSDYYADKITLSDASGALGGFASAPMSLQTAELVRRVPGVAAVSPSVMMLMAGALGLLFVVLRHRAHVVYPLMLWMLAFGGYLMSKAPGDVQLAKPERR